MLFTEISLESCWKSNLIVHFELSFAQLLSAYFQSVQFVNYDLAAKILFYVSVFPENFLVFFSMSNLLHSHFFYFISDNQKKIPRALYFFINWSISIQNHDNNQSNRINIIKKINQSKYYSDISSNYIHKYNSKTEIYFSSFDYATKGTHTVKSFPFVNASRF